MIAAPINGSSAKELGAFYTDPTVADFLVRWSIRSGADRVIDPSFGGGVFLRAAARRIRELGGNPVCTVFGIELDQVMHRAASTAAAAEAVASANLYCGDFFARATEFSEAFDVIVGNPPFIRYQQFAGRTRQLAAALMRRQDVEISELASSWAPFVVGATGLLRRAGRLAMVVPMELWHASYGRSVLRFLSRSFRIIHVVSFEKRLFPQLNQDTLLLLAEDRADTKAEIRWRQVKDAAALARLESPRIRARKLDADALVEGRVRLIQHLIPPRARDLYAELGRHEYVTELGVMADVGIGYVTGANGFFHLSSRDLDTWQIPRPSLRAAVCRGRALKGLRFTIDDWKDAYESGDSAYLFSPPRTRHLDACTKRYIEFGESRRTHLGYKCRNRDPWYRVPHVYTGDAFLTYMSGIAPRLVVNHAGAVAPNTLHVVRARPLNGISIQQLVMTWQSSLTQLSTELEGHAMGGGLLKLEPTEAGRVLLALPGARVPDDALLALDTFIRHGRPEVAQGTIDRMILRDRMGLSEKECRILLHATATLRARRLRRDD